MPFDQPCLVALHFLSAERFPEARPCSLFFLCLPLVCVWIDLMLNDGKGDGSRLSFSVTNG